MQIKLLDKTFTITAKRTKVIDHFPNDEKYGGGNRQQYSITVTSNDTGLLSRSFSYTGSIHDYERGHIDLDRSDLLNAFECILGDGLSGLMDVDQFASEFGYTKPSQAIKIHGLCKKTTEKLNDMGLMESELCDLINALHELEDSGQDREGYTDTQDRENYIEEKPPLKGEAMPRTAHDEGL